MPKPHIQEFTSVFQSLIRRYSHWQTWADFCLMSAVSISNAIDRRHYQKREQSYLTAIKRYRKEDAALFPELFAIMVNALEANPDQDFLGELFMQLDMGNHHKGQFFTPYNVSRCMAELQLGNSEALIGERGFITVSDPCCGAGGLLIAFANAARNRGINYQQSVLFTAQDIDPVVAMMCYIQLSLLGCAAEILIGNTLTNEPVPSENRWYTPLYFHEIWHWRRLRHRLIANTATTEPPFEHDGKEYAHERSGDEAAQGMGGAQRRAGAAIWIFGGFAG